MADAPKPSPKPGKLQPLSYIPLSPAKLLTSPGVAMIVGDDRLFAAMWRLAIHTWVHGPIPEAQADIVASPGTTSVVATLPLHGVCEVSDGMVSLPWVEDARTDSDALRVKRVEKSKAAAEARWRGRGDARSMPGACSSMPGASPSNAQACSTMPGEERREEERREEKLSPSVATQPQLSSLGSATPPPGAAEREATDPPPKKKKRLSPAEKAADAEAREAKRRNGPHLVVIETFQRAWAYNRCKDVLDECGFVIDGKTDPKSIPPGAKYIPQVADWAAAAKLWKETNGDMEVIRERMRNFFDSTADWMRFGGFSLFASKFSMLIQPINQLNSRKE